MKRCMILLTGAIFPSDKGKDDIIICADSGALSLEGSDIVPDHIIGDMDSIPSDVLSKFEASGANIHRFPEEKDLSDGELAIDLALQFEPDEIMIFGGKDGRVDHVLSSYHLLHLIPQDISSSLYLEGGRILLLREGDEKKMTTSACIISILPACDDCVVTVKGLKWELKEKQLKLGSTLGIHNESTGSPFLVKAVEGLIFLMMMDEL